MTPTWRASWAAARRLAATASRSRALVHLGADLFTFFAWEIPGTAFEMYVMGDRHLFLVRYGADGAVESVERLGRAADRPGDAGYCPGRAQASAALGEDRLGAPTLTPSSTGRPRAPRTR